MPLGAMNTSATLRRMMDYVLRDIPFAGVYINDVFAYSVTLEERIQHLEVVLRLIKERKLKLKFQIVI